MADLGVACATCGREHLQGVWWPRHPYKPAQGPLERVAASMRHPVRFSDGGVERCLTLDEAASLIRRVEVAIKQAHAEIAAGPIDLPICSRCNDTHEMAAWNGSGETWPCTGCPRPCDRGCRKSACSAFCDVTPCPCSCHASDHMYERARATHRVGEDGAR